MERTEIDIMINGSTRNQSPECSPLGEDTKTPDGAVTVPVKKQRKGSRWRCSGVVTKVGDKIMSYTTEEGIKYRKGGQMCRKLLSFY